MYDANYSHIFEVKVAKDEIYVLIGEAEDQYVVY